MGGATCSQGPRCPTTWRACSGCAASRRRPPCCHRYKVQGRLAGPLCTGTIDRKAHHPLNCAVGGFRTRRHHNPRDVLAAECKEAGHRSVATEVTMARWSVPDPENPGQYKQAVLDVYSEPPPRWEPRVWDPKIFHAWTAEGKPAKTLKGKSLPEVLSQQGEIALALAARHRTERNNV